MTCADSCDSSYHARCEVNLSSNREYECWLSNCDSSLTDTNSPNTRRTITYEHNEQFPCAIPFCIDCYSNIEWALKNASFNTLKVAKCPIAESALIIDSLPNLGHFQRSGQSSLSYNTPITLSPTDKVGTSASLQKIGQFQLPCPITCRIITISQWVTYS